MQKKFTISNKNRILKSISNFYDSRFEVYGNNINSIGWSNKKDQYLRFSYLLKNINLKNKSILDVGCGFGDLVNFISKKNRNDFKYTGIDISKKILNIAKEKYKKTNIVFINSDLDSIKNKYFDICIASGTLSYNHDYNIKFAENYIKKMFSLSKEVCCINFLSTYCNYKIKKNAHYSPENIFKFSKTLSKKVNLYHDYPLYEFTIQIFNK